MWWAYQFSSASQLIHVGKSPQAEYVLPGPQYWLPKSLSEGSLFFRDFSTMYSIVNDLLVGQQLLIVRSYCLTRRSLEILALWEDHSFKPILIRHLTELQGQVTQFIKKSHFMVHKSVEDLFVNDKTAHSTTDSFTFVMLPCAAVIGWKWNSSEQIRA